MRGHVQRINAREIIQQSRSLGELLYQGAEKGVSLKGENNRTLYNALAYLSGALSYFSMEQYGEPYLRFVDLSGDPE